MKYIHKMNNIKTTGLIIIISSLLLISCSSNQEQNEAGTINKNGVYSLNLNKAWKVAPNSSNVNKIDSSLMFLNNSSGNTFTSSGNVNLNKSFRVTKKQKEQLLKKPKEIKLNINGDVVILPVGN